jgi:hypothetical protein
MRSSTTLAAVLSALLTTASLAAAQTSTGVVRGEVVDDVGGVLPGVTVVATDASGLELAVAITDDVGRFTMPALPSGAVTISFRLEGFESRSVQTKVLPGVESWVGERMKLAQFTEQVMVYGKAPEPPPAPDYRPPPRPTIVPVPVEEIESICQPAKADLVPESIATIKSHRHEDGRGIYVKGDELNIDGGTLNGLTVGRNLVVRRLYRAGRNAGIVSMGQHTAGLVQIVTATERTATGIVVLACNEVMQGDFLASFEPQKVRQPDAVGTAQFDDPARILFADAGRLFGIRGRSMVIDRGHERGIRVGQRMTIFRKEVAGTVRPFIVGDAVVISVRADSATIRLERATDAVGEGDLAAPQLPGAAATPIAKNGLPQQ